MLEFHIPILNKWRTFICLSFGLISWLTDWRADRLTDRRTDRQTDWLTDWLTGWLSGWLADWFFAWLSSGSPARPSVHPSTDSSNLFSSVGTILFPFVCFVSLPVSSFTQFFVHLVLRSLIFCLFVFFVCSLIRSFPFVQSTGCSLFHLFDSSFFHSFVCLFVQFVLSSIYKFILPTLGNCTCWSNGWRWC